MNALLELCRTDISTQEMMCKEMEAYISTVATSCRREVSRLCLQHGYRDSHLPMLNAASGAYELVPCNVE